MTNPTKYPCIAIGSSSELLFYWPGDILYCKSDGNTTTIFLKGGGERTTSKKLKDLEAALPQEVFVRVHHSYVINLMHVLKFYNDERKSVALSEGHEIQVSRRRKAEFLTRFVKL